MHLLDEAVESIEYKTAIRGSSAQVEDCEYAWDTLTKLSHSNSIGRLIYMTCVWHLPTIKHLVLV